MKLSILSVLTTLTTAHAFTIFPSTLNTPFLSEARLYKGSHTRSLTPHYTASIDADQSKEGQLSPDEEWRIQLESDEVKEVRNELIQKYISKGRSMDFAEKEVDKFLSDPEQSRQFLEMRRYAKAQNDLGFEGLLQLAGAFTIGLVGQIGFKYLAASNH